MPEGIFAAAAGMAAQSARLDSIANDVANANTDGYQQVRTGFRDLVYDKELGVSIGAGAAAVDLGRSTVQGPLHQVDNPLALAIQGPGYFQVRTASGTTALTRAGDFQLDGNGEIVTSGGARLVPPIVLPKGAQATDVSISGDGVVRVGKTQIGAVQLVDVPAPAGLQSTGDGLFAPTQASGAIAPAKGGTLVQGSLEGSNVDMTTALVDMTDAQRSYSLDSRVIQVQDQLLQIANQLRA